jgi:hypothetical protein
MSDDLERELHLFIFQLEKELGIFDDNKSQIAIIWHRIRQIVSDAISSRIQGAAQNSELIERPFKKKITPLGMLGSAINRNLFIGFPKNKLIVFQNSRRVFDSGSEKYTDLYTDPLASSNLRKDLYLLEDGWIDGHKVPTLNTTRYIDFITYLSYLFGLLSLPFLTFNTKSLIEKVEKRAHERFGVQLDIISYAQKTLIKRNGTYFIYRLFFSLAKPKGILYIGLNTDPAIVEAANKQNIRTIELQHGVLGMSNEIYCKTPLNAIPKFFLSFGKCWNSNFKLPGCQNINVGYPFIDEKRRLFSGSTREKLVLVVSDGSLRMCNYAIRLAKNYPEYRIIFRLKPSEFDMWKAKYPGLFDATLNRILDVSSNNHEPVYSLLARSEYLVGTCSILIYEGLVMGCKTVVLRGPGYSYLRYLIDEKWVSVADENNIDLSLAPNIQGRDVDDLFMSNSINNIVDFLNDQY